MSQMWRLQPPLGWWVAAPKHDALVGGLPATVAGAVVDDVGLTARGINADAKASMLRSRRATAQGRNRRLAGRKVALGIIRRVRGLPEHVERRGRARLLGAAKGFLDRVAGDELAAEDRQANGPLR